MNKPTQSVGDRCVCLTASPVAVAVVVVAVFVAAVVCCLAGWFDIFNHGETQRVSFSGLLRKISLSSGTSVGKSSKLRLV